MRHHHHTSNDVLLVATILLCGLVLRLAWVVYMFGSPVGFVQVGEATLVAQALATGHGFADAYSPGSGPTAHISPLVPLIPGFLLWLFGPEGIAANIALQCWSFAQVVLAFLLGVYLFRLLGIGRSSVFLGLAVLSLVPVYFEQETFDFRWWEGAAATCLGFTSLILLLQLERRSSISTEVLMGIATLLGLTAFLSPPVGLASGACWAYFALRHLDWARRGKLLAGTAMVMAMLVTPWAIRNQQQLGSPVLLRSNAGLELALANHADALSDRPARDIFRDRYKQIHPFNGEEARAAMRNAGGEVAYSKKLGAEARQWILANPLGFVRLSSRHLTQFYFPEPWQLEFGAWDDFRPWRAGWIGLINIMGLVALGLGVWRGRAGYGYLAIYVACVTLPYMIVQPVPRYTYLVYVPLTFLAADGLVRSIGALIRKRRRLTHTM